MKKNFSKFLTAFSIVAVLVSFTGVSTTNHDTIFKAFKTDDDYH